MTYSFTFAGLVVLGIVGLLLASNEKTYPAVLFVLVLMIVLLIVRNYKQAENVLLTKG
jgi:uncharacterized membrane protein